MIIAEKYFWSNFMTILTCASHKKCFTEKSRSKTGTCTGFCRGSGPFSGPEPRSAVQSVQRNWTTLNDGICSPHTHTHTHTHTVRVNRWKIFFPLGTFPTPVPNPHYMSLALSSSCACGATCPAGSFYVLISLVLRPGIFGDFGISLEISLEILIRRHSIKKKYQNDSLTSSTSDFFLSKIFGNFRSHNFHFSYNFEWNFDFF